MPVTEELAIKCQEADLNRRHEDFQSSALPTELSRLFFTFTIVAESNYFDNPLSNFFLLLAVIHVKYYFQLSLPNHNQVKSKNSSNGKTGGTDN